jgi:hypothetical protein
MSFRPPAYSPYNSDAAYGQYDANGALLPVIKQAQNVGERTHNVHTAPQQRNAYGGGDATVHAQRSAEYERYRRRVDAMEQKQQRTRDSEIRGAVDEAERASSTMSNGAKQRRRQRRRDFRRTVSSEQKERDAETRSVAAAAAKAAKDVDDRHPERRHVGRTTIGFSHRHKQLSTLSKRHMHAKATAAQVEIDAAEAAGTLEHSIAAHVQFDSQMAGGDDGDGGNGNGNGDGGEARGGLGGDGAHLVWPYPLGTASLASFPFLYATAHNLRSHRRHRERHKHELQSFVARERDVIPPPLLAGVATVQRVFPSVLAKARMVGTRWTLLRHYAPYASIALLDGLPSTLPELMNEVDSMRSADEAAVLAFLQAPTTMLFFSAICVTMGNVREVGGATIALVTFICVYFCVAPLGSAIGDVHLLFSAALCARDFHAIAMQQLHTLQLFAAAQAGHSTLAYAKLLHATGQLHASWPSFVAAVRALHVATLTDRLLGRYCDYSCDVYLCSLRTQISRSICNFTRDSVRVPVAQAVRPVRNPR